MSKYLILLGTSLIILLALFVFSAHNTFAINSVTTGDTSSFTCVTNLVNTYSNYSSWFDANCHFACNSDHMCVIVAGEGANQCTIDSDCQTPTATPTPTPTPTPTITPTPTPSNPGGPGDGRTDSLGCQHASDNCGGSSPSQAVLGTSTKAVLGLSTTSV